MHLWLKTFILGIAIGQNVNINAKASPVLPLEDVTRLSARSTEPNVTSLNSDRTSAQLTPLNVSSNVSRSEEHWKWDAIIISVVSAYAFRTVTLVEGFEGIAVGLGRPLGAKLVPDSSNIPVGKAGLSHVCFEARLPPLNSGNDDRLGSICASIIPYDDGTYDRRLMFEDRTWEGYRPVEWRPRLNEAGAFRTIGDISADWTLYELWFYDVTSHTTAAPRTAWEFRYRSSDEFYRVIQVNMDGTKFDQRVLARNASATIMQ